MSSNRGRGTIALLREGKIPVIINMSSIGGRDTIGSFRERERERNTK